MSVRKRCHCNTIIIIVMIEDLIRKISPTNEFYFGFLRSEGMHGSNLTQREGVDLFNVTADLLLRWEVPFYLPPLKKCNFFKTELA